MSRPVNKVIRITNRLAFLLSSILTVALPLGYSIMSYEYQAAVLAAEAEAGAEQASRLISANPELWRFEQPRLEELLSRRTGGRRPEVRSIVGLDGTIIAESADVVNFPLITRSHDLFDSGTVVARLDISRSLRPLLVNTLGMVAMGLVLGAGLFIILRVYPLRALSHALQSLEESEEKFRAIAATAADAIIVIDNGGNITYWNAAAERMFGFTAPEAVGRDLHALFAPKDYHDAFRRGFEDFRTGGTGRAIGATLEFSALRKDGTTFPMEVSTSAVRMEGEWHAVGIVRDISERKQMEAELLKLEKLESLGVLAGGIAHDFNNMLMVLLGNVSLLKYDTDPSNPSYRLFDDMERAIENAKNLTWQLLTFAKGGMPIKRTASMKEIIEESCAFTLRGSKAVSSLLLPGDLLTVEVDPGQMGQVINNLVLNAAQAMPEGGTILVEGENIVVEEGNALPLRPGAYVKILVKDRGPGIPQEHLPKIFDPYFTTKEKGSGLGLSTAYSIIKNHGGYITAESEAGKGSTFILYLPSSEKPAVPLHVESEAPVRGQGKILVMDDDAMVRSVLKGLLEALGYEGVFAADGTDAIALYQNAFEAKSAFDAVIMDLTIPGGMGGKEAMQRLRVIDPGVKAIVASGYSDDPIMADFRTYGFSGVIAKPYTVEQLSRVLMAVIGNRRGAT